MKDKIINIITDYYDDGDSERHEMVANDLLNLFNVGDSFGNKPSEANEKHINLIIKFPTESIEIKEISKGAETTKTLNLNWD